MARTSVVSSISRLSVEEETERPLVFISYKWNQTKNDVWKVAEYLESCRRFTVWLDKQEMFANKLERMEQGIKSANVVVIFFSDDYQESVDCRTEAEAAYRHRKKKLFVKMKPNEKPLEDWFAPIIGNNIYVDFYQFEKPEVEIAAHVDKLLNTDNFTSKLNEIEKSRDIPAISSYVDRPDVEEELRQAFLEICLLSVTGGMLVYGEGGVGKTMLIAKAIALNEEFLLECGVSLVIWLNVFQMSQADSASAATTARKFYEMIADNINVKISRERDDAKDRLNDYFKTLLPNKVLLVIDDLFNENVLQPAFRLGDNVRCMAISRRRDVIESSCDRFLSQAIEIPTLSKEAVSRIFDVGRRGVKLDGKTVSQIADMCSGLPLLASVIRAKFRRFSTKRQAEAFARKLSSSYSKILISENWSESDKKRETISELLLCGFENESSEFRWRYYAFLLFEQVGNVAIEDLAILWQCNIDDAIEFCSEFYNMSLIRSNGSDFDTFTVHAFLYAAALEFATSKDKSLNGVDTLELLREAMLKNTLESANSENILHHVIKDGRRSLRQIVVDAATNSPTLLFDLCSQQEDKTKKTPLHYLPECPTKDETSFVLRTVCKLLNVMLAADENKASKILRLKDKCGAFPLQLLSNTVRPGTKWYHNALHLSASKDYTFLMKTLLDFGVDADSRDTESQTPLMTAVSFEKLAAMEVLLSWGGCGEGKSIDLNAYDKDSITALYAAVNSARIEVVELLLKSGVDVNIRLDVYQMSAIMMALSNGRLEIADLLFDHGAQIDDVELAVSLERARLRNDKNVEALFKKWNRLPERPDRFFESCFNVPRGIDNILDVIRVGHNGETLNITDEDVEIVVDALFHDNITRLQEHLELGKLSSDTLSATILAGAFFGNVAFMEVMLKNGANVDGNKNFWHPPLLFACDCGQLAAAEFLLANGATVDLPGFFKMTSLHASSGNGYPEIVNLLLRYGAKVDLKNTHNDTALSYAVTNNQADIVTILLAHDADVDNEDKDGNTPLILATINGNEGIAKRFLDANANVHIKNRRNLTASMVASAMGHSSIAKLILAASEREKE